MQISAMVQPEKLYATFVAVCWLAIVESNSLFTNAKGQSYFILIVYLFASLCSDLGNEEPKKENCDQI